ELGSIARHRSRLGGAPLRGRIVAGLDIPGMQLVKSSGVGGRVGLAVCPGFVFVVLGAVTYAAVQDAHESVAEGAQGLVVEVAGGAALVVESAGTGAAREGAEGPLVDGVVEATVADVAGEHGAFLTRGHGQW